VVLGPRPIEVSAFHAQFTEGYEFPTSIVANMTLERRALGHVTSSTDFMQPYTFLVELMGDRATLRQDLLQWLDAPVDLRRSSPPTRFRTCGSPRPPTARAAGHPHSLRDAGFGRSVAPSVPTGNRRVGRVRPRRPRDLDERLRRAEDDGGLPRRGPSAELGGQPVALPLIAG
jgi:hypothetical protein